MSEELLTVLKLCLLALLYLFFLRVLRAVWTEVSPPKVVTDSVAPTGRQKRVSKGARQPRSNSPKAGRRSSKVPTRLVVVEPPDKAGAQYQIDEEATVGRASGCNIVLDEQFVSQVHARFFVRGDTLFVDDLGSTNGTWVNGARAVGQMPIRAGDHVQVGNLVMEAR